MKSNLDSKLHWRNKLLISTFEKNSYSYYGTFLLYMYVWFCVTSQQIICFFDFSVFTQFNFTKVWFPFKIRSEIIISSSSSSTATTSTVLWVDYCHTCTLCFSELVLHVMYHAACVSLKPKYSWLLLKLNKRHFKVTSTTAKSAL